MRRLHVLMCAAVTGWVCCESEAWGQSQRPVQVYILSGQSNMVGFGKVSGASTLGTLEYLTNNGQFTHLGTAGNWTVRDDVWYKGVISATADKWLSPGTGADGDKFGPELQFGQVVGDYHDEPVLLLKTAQGNRSLGWDFLPPGSESYEYNGYTYAGYGQSPDRWVTGTTPTPINWYAGKQFDDSVAAAKGVLDNFETEFPDWADRGYEVAGFVWWQGHKDQSEPHASRYEQNMVRFIKEFRAAFNAPDAPFVLSTIAFGGWTLSGAGLTVAHGQLAVSGETGNYPEFADNVRTVEARDYWRDASVSPSTQGYHYNWNAETYLLVGDSLGRAATDLHVYRPFLEINRLTGEIKIINPSYGGLNMTLKDYTISSASGALNGLNWTPIDGNYDANGNGLIDDGAWAVTASTAGALSESALVGGDGGSILINNSFSLGVGAWLQNPVEDIRFTYTDALGVVRQLSVRYFGDRVKLADLDIDGVIEIDDWAIFVQGAQSNMSALSQAQAYRRGDLDGDGDNDIYDFGLFRQAFELDNPAPGAFQAMLVEYFNNQIPEPASGLTLLAGVLGLQLRRNRRARGATRRDEPRRSVRTPRAVASAGALTLAVGLLCVEPVHAVTLSINSSAPVVNGSDIANLATPTGGQAIWGDRPTQGQTFDATSAGGLLNSITVQLNESDGTILGWKDYRFRFGTVNSTTSSITVNVNQVIRQNPDVASDSYYTITLDSPVVLVPNTRYGFDLGLSGSEESWTVGIPILRQSGNTYAGGQSYSAGQPSNPGTALSAGSGNDLIFHADIDPFPDTAFFSLQVNTTSGAMSFLGGSIDLLNTINYYQITSAGGSLNVAGWRSLQDQDLEGNGPPTGWGNGWEEAGGAGSHVLAEAYLLGDSLITDGTVIHLGPAFDRTVDARDLVLTYRNGLGQIIDGTIDYFSPLLGDVDNDGDADVADINTALGQFTGPGGSLVKSWAQGDMDGDGDVDIADLSGIYSAYFGVQTWVNPRVIYDTPGVDRRLFDAAFGAGVPEPSTLGAMALGAGWLLCRAKRRSMRTKPQRSAR